ncbi:YrhC family protein [Evansella sp. AB-rgal1]|uniref:YrhC family protein n=1 Tax=Evansella sp. AB-rgal1 TaxID=3242696 RepID=UPI00359D87F3
MDEKKIIDLKNKVIDLKRFSFILLALCGFLAIGLVLPDGAVAPEHQAIMVGLNFILLFAALFFHRSAMAAQRIINEEE